jgi:glycosyltransferase involved in cell wall biosynthesis
MTASVKNEQSGPGNGSLLLVTYQFPFGSGEEFVETELKYLAAEYDDLWVVPARAMFSRAWWNGSSTAVARTLPGNCHVIGPKPFLETSYLRVAYNAMKLVSMARFVVPSESSLWRVFKEVIKEAVKASLFMEGVAHVFERHKHIRIAYTYWKGEATTGLLRLRRRQALAFKTVTRCHGGDLYYDLPHFPSRPFDTSISRAIDRVVPISETGAKHLIQHGFDGSRITLCRLGVAIPRTVSEYSSDGYWRIVSCASTTEIKRVPLLAAALKQLTHPFVWTHFGDGPESPEVDAITSEFPRHGSARLMGRRPHEEVLTFYQQEPVDLFVNVSVTEGVPVSIMEALAAGIPCIATDVGGTAELIDESVGRLLDVSSSASAIAEIIEVELEARARWLVKRGQARRRAEERCDADRNYASFSALLKSL